MDFYPLTASNLAGYLASVPAMRERFTGFDNLDVCEVGDGNLNFVYVVTDCNAPAETVVVKQALPYLRVAGEGWPLTRHRMDTEVAALRCFGALCPEHVPEVFHSSAEMSLVVMRNLREHRVLRNGLIDGITYPKLAEHLSTFMARTLCMTSDLVQAPGAKKEAVRQSLNPELCAITEDFVFTHPFDDHATNVYCEALPRAAVNRIQRNPALRAAVGEMKLAFMTRAEALLHGDLHTGSVMVNPTETYIIDPEFAFYGPMGFDVGTFLANLFLAYFAQDYRQRALGHDPQAYQEWLLECARETWVQFEGKFLALWREHDASCGTSVIGRDLDGHSADAFRHSFMRQLFTDSLGFAACEMMRRVVGLGKVADIAGIPDLHERADAEVKVLRMAERLVIDRARFNDMPAVLDWARSVASGDV